MQPGTRVFGRRIPDAWGSKGRNSQDERLYKLPMNPYVVSSCLRASLRFSYATHVFAYKADSEHVELARRLRVGAWSVSAQELLTRAPFSHAAARTVQDDVS